MIILPENVLMIHSGRNSNNTEGSLLRMTDDEHSYALDYAKWRGLRHGFKHVRDKNDATASLSAHKKGGTFWIKHDHVLTAKQAKLVYKELNTSNNIISIKKIMTPSIPEEIRVGQCLPEDINHRV